MKAIDTKYKGVRFRSRTEARWAVFFDTLGVKWEYEKEGYDLGNGIYYLPDFWFPEYRSWGEVKPDAELNQMEWEKAFRLCEHTKCDVNIFKGVPAFGYDQEPCEIAPGCAVVDLHVPVLKWGKPLFFADQFGIDYPNETEELFEKVMSMERVTYYAELEFPFAINKDDCKHPQYMIMHDILDANHPIQKATNQARSYRF